VRGSAQAGQDGAVTDRTSPVSEIMHTEFLVLGPDDPVEEAMRALVEHDVEAAPVAKPDGTLVGVLSNTDLIVQESQLHFPTVLSFLGALIEVGHKHFQEDLDKALGSKVSEVMTADPISCEETDTVEAAATVMHDKDIGHLPVVRAGRVVGMVSRNDLLRAILASP
jgi:CBS domain-containing protein